MTRPLGVEFVQLEQPNAAVIEETAPVAVAQAEVVQVGIAGSGSRSSASSQMA